MILRRRVVPDLDLRLSASEARPCAACALSDVAMSVLIKDERKIESALSRATLHGGTGQGAVRR